MSNFKSLLSEGVEIGVINSKRDVDGEKLTPDELREFVSTASYKNYSYKPYISKGHDGVRDGGSEPAWGIINPQSIRYDEMTETLYVTPEFVHESLTKDIEEGKYQKLSVEFVKINYKDIDLYGRDKQPLTNYQAMVEYMYHDEDDNSVFDNTGKPLKFDDVFKNFLLGVAVLGRSMPAFPDFDISAKIKSSVGSSYSKRVITPVAISKDKLNIKTEVKHMTDNTEKVERLDFDQEDENSTQVKTDAVETKTMNINKAKSQNNNTKQESQTSFLTDATDVVIKKKDNELSELKNKLNYEVQQKETIEKKVGMLEKEICSLKTALVKETVYNIWLNYKNEGKLLKEDVIDNSVDWSKKASELMFIPDKIERAVATKELEKEVVCSGAFFKDYETSTESQRKTMIRNIERREPMLKKNEMANYTANVFNTSNDVMPNEDRYKKTDILYEKARDIARSEGVDINSAEFDILTYRRKAYDMITYG